LTHIVHAVEHGLAMPLPVGALLVTEFTYDAALPTSKITTTTAITMAIGNPLSFFSSGSRRSSSGIESSSL